MVASLPKTLPRSLPSHLLVCFSNCYHLGALCFLNHWNWRAKTSSLAYLLGLRVRGGRAGSLYGASVWAGPGVRLEVWLRWSTHPFGGVECWDMHSILLLLLTPCFCTDLWDMEVRFLNFLYLLAYTFPQLHMSAVIFSPL